jgi:hypothetical protein
VRFLAISTYLLSNPSHLNITRLWNNHLNTAVNMRTAWFASSLQPCIFPTDLIILKTNSHYKGVAFFKFYFKLEVKHLMFYELYCNSCNLKIVCNVTRHWLYTVWRWHEKNVEIYRSADLHRDCCDIYFYYIIVHLLGIIKIKKENVKN